MASCATKNVRGSDHANPYQSPAKSSWVIGRVILKYVQAHRAKIKKKSKKTDLHVSNRATSSLDIHVSSVLGIRKLPENRETEETPSFQNPRLRIWLRIDNVSLQ